MVLSLKLLGQYLWFCGWKGDMPIWGKRINAITYYTEELAQGDYWSLVGLGCKVLIVREA